MLTYLMAALTIIAAALSCLDAYRKMSVRPITLTRTAAGLFTALFVFLYGTWFYLSVFLKYVFAVVYFLICAVALRKNKSPRNRRFHFSVGQLLIIGILDILYFTGTVCEQGTASLSFPLKSGNYLVMQGGKGLPTNFFHYSYRGAVFAMDITKLNRWGNRANRVFSTNLNDYAIFSDTIYSPCSGIVRRVHDDNPDNRPPTRKRGPSNTNQVLIEGENFYVFLAHLKFKCVFVAEGQHVKTGTPLGLVGNSGFSLEPHLHIQAHRNSGTGKAWYQEEPLLILFSGKSYRLFDPIRAQPN